MRSLGIRLWTNSCSAQVGAFVYYLLSPRMSFPLEGEPTAKSQNHRSEHWEGDGGLHQDIESSILFYFLVWHRGPVLPAVKAQSLNPWTSREVSPALFVRWSSWDPEREKRGGETQFSSDSWGTSLFSEPHQLSLERIRKKTGMGEHVIPMGSIKLP